jgi:hypothetical protein
MDIFMGNMQAKDKNYDGTATTLYCPQPRKQQQQRRRRRPNMFERNPRSAQFDDDNDNDALAFSSAKRMYSPYEGGDSSRNGGAGRSATSLTEPAAETYSTNMDDSSSSSSPRRRRRQQQP